MSKVEILNCVAIYGESEPNEGKGPQYLAGIASNQAIAEKMAEGKGVMGSPGTMKPCKVLLLENGETYLLDKPVAVFSDHPNQILDRLKTKLSSEERAVLARLTAAELRNLAGPQENPQRPSVNTDSVNTDFVNNRTFRRRLMTLYPNVEEAMKLATAARLPIYQINCEQSLELVLFEIIRAAEELGLLKNLLDQVKRDHPKWV